MFANLLRKFRFSLLITGTGGVIFFNPIQLQDSISFVYALLKRNELGLLFVCVFFKYFPFCMHGGHNLMPKCNVEKRH